MKKTAGWVDYFVALKKQAIRSSGDKKNPN